MQHHFGDSIFEEDLEILSGLNTFNWYKLQNKSILVTGSTGLIGSQLIKAILYSNRKYNLNIELFALARDVEKTESIFGELSKLKELHFIFSDITLDLSGQFAQISNIDYIIHTASITSSKLMIDRPVDTLLTSVLGTNNILRLAVDKKVESFVYVSSMEVYGSFYDDNLVEVPEEKLGFIDPLEIRSNYPESKRLCENLCISYAKQFGISAKIARLSQTFGAGILKGENRIFAQFAKSILFNQDIILHTDGSSIGNYCYTRDCLSGILTILVKGKDSEAYNVSNEESCTSIYNMALLVKEHLALNNINIIFDIPESNMFGYAKKTNFKLSSQKLCQLGWTPQVSLIESYQRLVKSMSENADIWK